MACIVVVGYGVECVGVSKADSSFGGSVGSDRKLCATREVAELMDAVCFAIIASIAAAVKW